MSKSISEKNQESNVKEKRPRGRPRKVRTAEELAKLEEKKRHKLSLSEKQAIKLQAQKEKQAAKKARGESEPKNRKRFYCTNKELQAELINWRDSNKAEEEKLHAEWEKTHQTAESKRAEPFQIDYTKRKVSEELGKMLLDIGNKLLNHSSFRNYSKELKEDMLGQFILKVMKGLKNYNFEFNNPFAFLTTSAWNSFLIVINKHYKQQNIRKDLMMKLSLELESYSGISPNTSLNRCIKTYLGSDSEAE